MKSKHSGIFHLATWKAKAKAFLWKHVVWSVCIFICLTWFIAAYLVYFFESQAGTGNIKTYSDALWWGIVTFLTVGYGDFFPHRSPAE